MASANPGFSLAASVDGVIRFSPRAALGIFAFQLFFVKNRIGDHVLFAGPGAQIQKPAAFAAKWKILVGFGVRRLLADGAAMLHGQILSQNAQCRSSGDAMELFVSGSCDRYRGQLGARQKFNDSSD